MCLYTVYHTTQTYSVKDHMHTYGYQGLVLPTGVALAWGPWSGNESDSNKMRESGLLDDLTQISGEDGRNYFAFGDTAYVTHKNFEHIIAGECHRDENLLNELKQRWRITVIFTCCSMCYNFVYIQVTRMWGGDTD